MATIFSRPQCVKQICDRDKRHWSETIRDVWCDIRWSSVAEPAVCWQGTISIECSVHNVLGYCGIDASHSTLCEGKGKCP